MDTSKVIRVLQDSVNLLRAFALSRFSSVFHCALRATHEPITPAPNPDAAATSIGVHSIDIYILANITFLYSVLVSLTTL